MGGYNQWMTWWITSLILMQTISTLAMNEGESGEYTCSTKFLNRVEF